MNVVFNASVYSYLRLNERVYRKIENNTHIYDAYTMRLLDIAPLKHLIHHGLTRANTEQARSFLALGEKLKFTEQKLNYLKRCLHDGVYPVFILRGVKVVDSLFRGEKTDHIKNLEDSIRK